MPLVVGVLHELDEGRLLGRLPEKVEELFTDLADLSPGPAVGNGRLFRIRRTTWLALEDSPSFLEALDGVILDADALRQIVDLLVPVLVLFFQGQQPVSHLRVRVGLCWLSSWLSRCHRFGVWRWPRVRRTLALGLPTPRRRGACAVLLLGLNARIWAHESHFVGISPRAAARGWHPTPIMSRSAFPMHLR
jgi:hypothetical protein